MSAGRSAARGELRDLVLVACHAAFKRDVASVPDRPERDEGWALESFQHGEPPDYIAHIRRGVELAEAEAEALLLFTGGRTREASGEWSEARTYFEIAEHHRWWMPETYSDDPSSGVRSADVHSVDARSADVARRSDDLRRRAATEEFARDSYENLLFGLCRFQELTGRSPRRVMLVSWAFKAARFDRHRAAIRFPSDRFRFEGLNQPLDLERAQQGERKALECFAEFPHGTGGDVLAKRKARTFGSRAHGYGRSRSLRELVRAIESLVPCRPELPRDFEWR